MIVKVNRVQRGQQNPNYGGKRLWVANVHSHVARTKPIFGIVWFWLDLGSFFVGTVGALTRCNSCPSHTFSGPCSKFRHIPEHI